MILDLLGLDKKMATWICAAIVSVSLLTTTIVWAKTYYDIRADAVAIAEAAKKKKDTVAEFTEEKMKKAQNALDYVNKAIARQFTDRKLCVIRTLTDEKECGPHTFDNKEACEKFKQWIIETDKHKVNTYECKVIE